MHQMTNFARLISSLLIIASPLAAQDGIVTGKLVDKMGNPVVGYPIIIENVDKSGYSEVIGITSDDGSFQATIEQSGDYSAVLPTAQTSKRQFNVPSSGFGGFFGLNRPHSADLGTIQLP